MGLSELGLNYAFNGASAHGLGTVVNHLLTIIVNLKGKNGWWWVMGVERKNS